MKVLVVEDDAIQNKNLARIIEKYYFDIRVYKAFSVKEALEIVNNQSIDLIFEDINLPDGTGIELAKKIRNINGYELTGIVFITSEMFQVVDAFKNTHCYDFLVKPYSIDDIKRIIDVFNKTQGSEIEEKGDYTIINVDNNVSIKVYHSDIVFVEYVSRKCIIHTTKSDIECKNLTLSKLFDKIQSDTIVQSHKSYIVNTKYIEKIDKQYSKLWDISFIGTDMKAELSAKFKDRVFESWNK